MQLQGKITGLLLCAALLLVACGAVPYPAVQRAAAAAAQPAAKVAAPEAAAPEEAAPDAAAPEEAAPAADPVVEEAFFDECPQGADWVRHGRYCYRYFETEQYWYLAELDCRKYGGHLLSINNRPEDTFAAKLTYCESAWTGRYAVDVDKLNDPKNYRFTDNTGTSYHAHDFTSIGSIHEPLISVSNLTWRNNVYHTKQKYVCKVASPGSGNSTGRCTDAGWKHLNGFCYYMPQETATYIEATFYCHGRSAHLTSIHTDEELRSLSLHDLSTHSCPASLWVGLIKLNPCRIDFSTGQKICYKWADRLVDFYDGFPAWHPGFPDTGERVNCVLLENRAMKTVHCYERHRFICKKPARG